jgi:hypothetical protein
VALNAPTSAENGETAVRRATAAVEQHYAAKTAELESSFWKAVKDQVQKTIAPQLAKERERLRESVAREERERFRETFERSQRALNDYVARRDGIKQAITKKEYQLLLNCLHPDHAPPGREEPYKQAFNVVKRLRPYIDSFEKTGPLPAELDKQAVDRP